MNWRARTLGPTRLASAVLAAGLSACGSRDKVADPRTESPLVLAAIVRPADPSLHGFNGVIAARVESQLGFRVAGKVIARLADAGEAVKRGDVLMRLDAEDYDHAVVAQQGAAAAARARLTDAAADEARYADLVSSGAVSRSSYDQAKAAADGARAQFAAASAELKVTEDAASYATLRADADGVVIDTAAEPGQYVAVGQTVVRLAHAGPREAEVGGGDKRARQDRGHHRRQIGRRRAASQPNAVDPGRELAGWDRNRHVVTVEMVGRGGGGRSFGGRGGGGRGGGGRGGRRSDIRLKHDIVFLGYLNDGLGFYRFSYNGSKDSYVGVMAQDVLRVAPGAVTRGRDGFLRVNYEKLGLQFQDYSHWLSSGARIPVVRLH